jgi:hypothetical protein
MVGHGTMYCMMTQDPEWIVVLGYENLPGCPHPQRAVCA